MGQDSELEQSNGRKVEHKELPMWNILETEADTEINLAVMETSTFGISARILPQLKIKASDKCLAKPSISQIGKETFQI